MSKSEHRKSLPPGARAADLRRWLEARCRLAAEAGKPITKQRAIRTSSRDPNQFEASMTTSFASMERTGDVDVIVARELGFDVVRRDPSGDAARESLGDAAFVVRMWHAPGGVGRGQLGVIVHIGETFFVYLLSSARAANLEADTEDRRGNAATEIIAAVTRAMFKVGSAVDASYRTNVHAREHERIIRDEGHGSDLKRTFIASRVIAHLPHRIDMSNPAEAQSFSFGTMIAAGAIEGSIRGMNRAEIVMQAAGGYYGDIRQAPFTHGPSVTLETDTQSGVQVLTTNPHRLALTENVDEARTRLRAFVDAILDGPSGGRRPRRTDWEKVADLAVKFDLPSRLPRDLKRNIRIRHKRLAGRVACVQSIFSERWIEGLRKGYITVDVPVKTEMTNLDLDDDVTLVARAGRQYYRCRVTMPIPADGWGITEQEWELVLQRRYPEQATKSPRTGRVHPLVGIELASPFEEGREQQFASKDRYVLYSFPAPADGQGRLPLTDNPDRRHDATARPADLHRSIAVQGLQALLHLHAATLPLPLHVGRGTQRPAAGGPQESVLDREALQEAVEDAEASLAVALDGRNNTAGRVKRGKDLPLDLARAESALARATATADEAQRMLQAHDAQPAGGAEAPTAPVEEEVDVRSGTAEFVLAALEKCPGAAPAWLNQACGLLFDDWQMQVRPVDGGRDRLHWSCDMVLDLVDCDEQVRLPLHGWVHSHANATTGAAASTVEDWAWSFFLRAESFAEIGKDCGIDGSGKKNSHLYKGLIDWLATAVPDPTLRNAALHCPVPATRRILWFMVTGDETALSGIDEGFVRHIRQTYGQLAWLPKWSWCRDTHTDARRVATYLARQPGASAPVHQIIADLRIGYGILVALTAVNGASTKGSERRTKARAVPYFDKSFSRGAPTMKPDDKRVLLRACEHDDCPARLRGELAYCSIVINVPETEQAYGVLCSVCLRLPGTQFKTVWMPEDYRRPWAGRFGRGSHRTGARKQPDWTWLDPGITDPGAAAELPDTGATPRPPRPRPARASQDIACTESAPLGRRRVLPLGLTDVELQAVAEVVEALGGKIGSNVKASLAAVVVRNSAGKAAPRAVRAVALGVPVLTLQELVARPMASWAAEAAA